MPTSNPALISPICLEILKRQPLSVLDIGMGVGKFGALCREYTDIWGGRLARKDWKTVIHGIEVFPEYRNSVWDMYDVVRIADIRELYKTLPPYDLVNMVEVLEHLPKHEGVEVLTACRNLADTFIFSYTNSRQGAAFGNSNECHISEWSEKDFPFPVIPLYRTSNSGLFLTDKRM